MGQMFSGRQKEKGNCAEARKAYKVQIFFAISQFHNCLISQKVQNFFTVLSAQKKGAESIRDFCKFCNIRKGHFSLFFIVLSVQRPSARIF